MMQILVATDFSTRSDRALRRSVLIAGEFDAAITLVHVIDDDQPAHLIERQRAAASELLNRTVQSMRSVDAIPATAVVATGDPFAGILRVADEIQPDLIVVGPHRRQLLDVFVGTTADRTIRRSRYPVLMSNAFPSGPYGRTLLAIDFDEASRSAAEAVRRLNFVKKSNLTAIHLFDTPAVGLMRRAMEGDDAIDNYVRQEALTANSQFHSFLSAAKLLGVERLLRPYTGSPAEALLSRGRELRADLLVVGTNQRTGVRKIVLGSVAQEILADADCDVLVVPAASDADRSATSDATQLTVH
jgi:nucleotide-binding universal stress UspA family protein